MKKLLLATLFLMSAMAYGQENIVQIPGQTATEQAKGYLPIESRGEVLAPTGKIYLEITPTLGATPDGTALGFNHGKIVKGTVGQKLMGKYEAKVIKYETGNSTTIYPGQYTASLKTTNTSSVGEVMGNRARITINRKVNNRPKGLGTLYYELMAENSGEMKMEVHRGSVISYFDTTGVSEGTTGSFINRTARIEVEVSGLELGGSN